MAWGGVDLFSLERLPARCGRVRTRADAGRGAVRGSASSMAWVRQFSVPNCYFIAAPDVLGGQGDKLRCVGTTFAAS